MEFDCFFNLEFLYNTQALTDILCKSYQKIVSVDSTGKKQEGF